MKRKTEPVFTISDPNTRELWRRMLLALLRERLA